VRTLPCDAAIGAARKWFPHAAGPALDPARIRILTWNIHKEDDAAGRPTSRASRERTTSCCCRR
jgi:hypothetical protein